MLFLAHQLGHTVAATGFVAASSFTTTHYLRHKRPFEWRMPVWVPAFG